MTVVEAVAAVVASGVVLVSVVDVMMPAVVDDVDITSVVVVVSSDVVSAFVDAAVCAGVEAGVVFSEVGITDEAEVVLATVVNGEEEDVKV